MINFMPHDEILAYVIGFRVLVRVLTDYLAGSF